MDEFQGYMLLAIASGILSEQLDSNKAPGRALVWQIIAAIWTASAIFTLFAS